MCSACDDTGLTFARGGEVDHGVYTPPIAICGDIHCAQGQRIAKVLTAIARGEPIAVESLEAFFVDRPCIAVGPMPANRKLER
jgi:hypothetical protein